MAGPDRTYLPAAGRHWSLPLYDPVVKLLGGDGARELLLDQAAAPPAAHKHIGQIRLLVGFNLVLGLATVVIGASGRGYH
jgi:hypothetical protein